MNLQEKFLPKKESIDKKGAFESIKMELIKEAYAVNDTGQKIFTPEMIASNPQIINPAAMIVFNKIKEAKSLLLPVWDFKPLCKALIEDVKDPLELAILERAFEYAGIQVENLDKYELV